MQGSLDCISQACGNLDLAISTKKSVVHKPAPGNTFSERTKHRYEWTKLQVVDKFTYLGNILSRAVQTADEVTARTAKASVAFGRLRTNVCERN